MNLSYRVPEIKVEVLGVGFQAFLDPSINQPVFSQRGVARALEMPSTSLRRILASETNKILARGGFTLHRTRHDR